MSNAKYIQEGFTAVTPYIFGKIELIDFLTNAFAAEVTHPPTPDSAGHFHAEAKIGGAHVLIGNGYFTNSSMSAGIYLYVPDVDATYKKALSLGATSLRAPVNESWGDRVGGVKDNSGNTWWLATHKNPQ